MTEDELLAAEFALGLLSRDESEAVRMRANRDAALALRIAWWRDQLTPLARESESAPPESLWPRIAARLPVNDNRDTARPWKFATGGIGVVAAGLFAFIVLRPAPIPVTPLAPPAPMIAALSGADGNVVAVSFEAASGRMVIAPTQLDPGKGDAELWIIPEGGKAVSMGVIAAKGMQAHMVPMPMRPMMQPGATFAITQEAKGGSPTGQAQGPIVASGKIIRT